MPSRLQMAPILMLSSKHNVNSEGQQHHIIAPPTTMYRPGVTEYMMAKEFETLKMQKMRILVERECRNSG